MKPLKSTFLLCLLYQLTFNLSAQIYTNEVRVVEGLNGAVGIGVESPAPNTALDVLGNVKVDGSISGSSISSGYMHVNGRLAAFSNSHPIYRWYFGGGTDIEWKTIAFVTIGTGSVYESLAFEVDIASYESNHGTSVAPIIGKFFVAMRRSSGGQDNHNDALVSGPFQEYVRVVKTATGQYELQVRPQAYWKHMEVVARVVSQCCSSIQVAYQDDPPNGSVSGTIYYGLNHHTSYFTNAYVNATVSASTFHAHSGQNWPDYVFDEGYVRPPLPEVEKYILENRHLPGVPGEKEVAENGIDLTKMDATLLKKIEELTLYLIEQNKSIERLQSEVERLKADRK